MKDFLWRKPNRFFLIALAVILIDQGVKVWVKLTLGAHYQAAGCHSTDASDVPVIGNFFRITFAENPGAAFSMTFSDFLPFLSLESSKMILTVFSFFALGIIVYFLMRVRNFPNALPYLIALILGGAVGNIIDRAFYGLIFCDMNCSSGIPGDFDYYPCSFLHGRVVDMFYLDIYRGVLPGWIPIWGGEYMMLWPIFNVADSAIFVGIGYILLFQGRLFGTRKKPVEPLPGSDAAEHKPETKSDEAPPAT